MFQAALLKLSYLRQKLDSYRIYNYKDFRFYNDKTLESFENYQAKLHAFRENPQNILHFNTTTNTFSCKDSIESNSIKPLIFEPNKITQDTKSTTLFKDYEAKVQGEIDNMPKDSKKFIESKEILKLDSISINPNVTTNLQKLFSCKIFSKDICVISPDFLFSNISKIAKNETKIPRFRESSCLLNAQIPADSQTTFYLQNMDKETLTFQLFSIQNEILNTLSTKTKKPLIFLNPLEIFSTLYSFYPSLSHYTLILQGQSRHALCHYYKGFLCFAIVCEKAQVLQDFYKDIENLGEIFYCDYSGERVFVDDFKNIESCFELPLNDCLKILAFKYLREKGLDSIFMASGFLRLRAFLKLTICSSIVLILCLFLNLSYEHYTHHDNKSTQTNLYNQDLQEKAQRKKAYTPMYNRIYTHLKDKKSLNFRFNDKKEAK
ncbi:hypothetical protein DCO58_00320 [Helicobacter saguini]|uniref:Transmembrane protein n=1 Tax=Helicobacter saguini TaxID=1548018 RepID=A0A347VQT8_9HELI|nr:hypothetical protein [Helicobacter saguini]MWV63162.1 hypothetical protein [Helicobacter saguini]MWV66168.1 hypothetical protein [Helicobacter saguini]MWV68517.1 hypothetical protein [Helicobacter saguini]MWV71928.1 hypothetical protein [Helicobacter saguini]TLD95940.1 hypothetical protein LS64_000835 [Helicobacter saguini]